MNDEIFNDDINELIESTIKETKKKKNNNKNRSRSMNGNIIHVADNIKSNNEFINKAHNDNKEKENNDIKAVNNSNRDFPYIKTSLLTDAEIQLYNFMERHLHYADRVVILPKVRLADIIEVDKRITIDKEPLWKITNKHVDFLICKKDTLEIICVVELDDYTHDTKEAKDRDMFVMEALRVAGIQTIRITTQIAAITVGHLDYLNTVVDDALAFKCPLCGNKMVTRRAGRDRRWFYACVDNMNCRHTIPIDIDGERLI